MSTGDSPGGRQSVTRHSAETYRLLVENLRDFAVFMMDRGGRITSWNLGVGHVLGYGEPEFVGRPAAMIFTPEDCAAGVPEQELATAEAEGRAEDTRWHLRRDGTRFWSSGLTVSLRDESGRLLGFAKVMRDATAHKLAEERLRESEARFQQLVELSPDAIAVHAEGRLLFINTAGAKLLRAESPAQIIGRPVAELLHPAYHEVVRERVERMSRGETAPPAEMKFIRLDGTEIYGEVASALFIHQGKPAVQAVVRDLTPRKQAEEALRESEERFRIIFNQQFQFMAILSPEGVLLDVNELPLRATGITREQVMGKLFWETPWWEGLPEMRAGWPVRLAAAARSDEPVFSEDLYQAADGVTRVADASITAVKNPEGGVEFFIVQASDITERKRVEEERERLLREARQANRLKDEFLATLSHELRTPLTSILGWSRLLQTNSFDETRLKNALAVIERNARAQTQLVDDLLDVSRIITGKLRLDAQPVDLTAAIRAATDTLRPAAEAKEIDLQTLLDPGVGPVSGDPDRLQQVVWNLVSNAIKFTPRGGRVEVRLGRVGSQVEIVVSDTGAGIAPEFLPYVFDRFRQADQKTTRQHGGLGLGLAIVRQLVELHGGTVSAASGGQGRGATFTVRLPLLPLRAAAAPGEERVGRQSGAGAAPLCPPQLDGLRVLVVDDEEDTRDMLVAALTGCGAQVTPAGSTAEALAAFERERPDVLVSDIGMPEEDGYALIREVRARAAERGGRVPAIALTACAREEDRRKAIRAGYQMHMSKPADLDELTEVIASFAGRAGNAEA